jgi:hypothetical protein
MKFIDEVINVKMTERKKKDPIEEGLKLLHSPKEADQIKALEIFRIKGDFVVIEPIVRVLNSKPSTELEDKIVNFLFDLTDSKAIPGIIDAIDNPDFRDLRAFLISIFWQSKLEPTDHIEFLVKHACYGSYHECLEVLTVIENIDSPINEQTIQFSLAEIDAALEKSDQEKVKLLVSLKQILENF